MPSSFTIKNTSGDHTLDVRIQGGGKPQEASLIPGEEQTFEVDHNSHVSVNQGKPVAPTQHR